MTSKSDPQPDRPDPSPKSALRRFFCGIAEAIFQSKLGVADPPLIDYVSGLMLRFLRVESVYRIRSVRGQPLTRVGEMVAEANERIGNARREVHRHIGDYTLFWAGLYPESLRPKRGLAVDEYSSFCTQGKRAYWIASSIETDDERGAPSELLERLSHQFELCAYGLREVRREWENQSDGDLPNTLLV